MVSCCLSMKEKVRSEGLRKRFGHWFELIVSVLESVTIEPVVFSYLVAWTLQSTLTTNLLHDKVCISHGFGEKACKDLSISTTQENNVQRVVSQYNMYLKLIQNIPSILFVLFLGSWSDKNGRKIPIILPLVGSYLTSVICLINAYLWWLNPEHILMSAVPRAMTGGSISLMMAAYSYVSDISKIKSRTTRIAVLDFMFLLSPPIGLYLSDLLYNCIGYTGVYVTSGLIFIACILYVAIFIKDSRGPLSCNIDTLEILNSPNKANGLFNVENVRETMDTCLKKRKKRNTFLILMLDICLMNVIFGSTGLDYLYVKAKFAWNYSQYVHLTITQFLMFGFGTSVILPILSIQLNVEGSMLGILGCLSKISSSIIQAFAYFPWHLYLAAFMSVISGIPLSVARSEMSKLIPAEDLGKAFSMLASWECVIPLISNPLYTFTYEATIEHFPGAIFLINFVVYVVSGIVFVSLFLKSYLEERIKFKMEGDAIGRN